MGPRETKARGGRQEERDWGVVEASLELCNVTDDDLDDFPSIASIKQNSWYSRSLFFLDFG